MLLSLSLSAFGMAVLITTGSRLHGRQAEAGVAASTQLRFEVQIAPELQAAAQDGRLLVVLGRQSDPEPRSQIGETGMEVPPVLGRDVERFQAGTTAVIDQQSAIFPLTHLAQLPPGDYFVQAVFHTNPELNVPDAPGNLYSKVQRVHLDPSNGGPVPLLLSERVPAEEVPLGDAHVRYLKIPSKLLSRFHGRPMFLRAGVILPREYDREPRRHYPLRVHIGGYGTRFTAAGDLMARGSPFRQLWLSGDVPRMILLHTDGAGPYGDPYQVNSDNNGPYGDAITQELIPYVEKEFRAVGRPQARFLDGTSTGGWVSLGLQVFYPDFFNGAWSCCPDPVDFREFEVVNIYEDDNMYINKHGFERPSMRDRNGDVRYTLRHECQREIALGRGNRWTLSGKDWGAVFGSRGADGLPVPLFDGRTGKIDRSVLQHWKQYDLRLVLETSWRQRGPYLQGKIHVWAGEADEYFLNNAVHLLDHFLERARPAYGGWVRYGMGGGHGWRDLDERQLMTQMLAAR
jgi:Putative esterase